MRGQARRPKAERTVRKPLQYPKCGGCRDVLPKCALNEVCVVPVTRNLSGCKEPPFAGWPLPVNPQHPEGAHGHTFKHIHM